MKRWLSALVGIPIACLVLIFGNKYVISVVMGVIAVMCLYEYFSAFKEIANPMRFIGYISCLYIFLLPWIKQEQMRRIYSSIVSYDIVNTIYNRSVWKEK